MSVRAFSHIALRVTDLDRSLRFYRDGIGFVEISRVELIELPGESGRIVGHSLGGFVIPRVALEREVGGLLYLCAGLPPRNEAEHRVNVEVFSSSDPPQYGWDEQERMTMSPETAAKYFYSDCTPELHTWAAA